MASVTFDVLLRSEHFVAIDKPAGFHVHQPEFPRRRVAQEITCLPNLRRQINEYLYPVHRIDVATEGVLVFALNKPSASGLCRQFQEGTVKKTYFAIVRGWTLDEGVIDTPLALDSTGDFVPAVTRYRTHARAELPNAVGKKHASARYSLVEAMPESGRFHQIRRHMAGISHPVVGDTSHGDSYHNRFFRTELEAPGLWLKAREIEFQNPQSGEAVRVRSPWGERWKRIHERLGWQEVNDDR
jgi:tRNA pseudouridine65 synthase